mgnify:FL=1
MSKRLVNYFESIKEVCPYSAPSYKNGKLLVLDYDPKLVEEYYHVIDDYDAIMFECHSSTSREALMDILEDLHDERPRAKWFWSHPKDEHHSTPKPSIIMQNKVNLKKARKEFFSKHVTR